MLYVGGLDSAQKGAVGTHTRGVLNAFEELGVKLHAVFLEDQIPDFYRGSLTAVPASKIGGYHKKILDRGRIANVATRLAADFNFVYTRYDPFISPLIRSDNIILEYNDDFLTQIKFASQHGQFSTLGREFRNTRLYVGLIIAIERYCFRKASLVACVTNRLCDVVSARQPGSRVFCMLNGSDAFYDEALDPSNRDGVLRIGHIGTITYWDGLKDLMYGLAEFVTSHPAKKVELLVLGDGSLKAELMSLAQDLSLRDTVKFEPSTDHRGALVALHQVDVVPLLKTISAYDLSPIKFYEALCTGRFVLCSDIPHINEVNHDQGMVVSFPLDVTEISRALATLHERLPEIRNGFARRSALAVMTHSWRSRVQSLIEVLEGEDASRLSRVEAPAAHSAVVID